ncbi:MAG: hypothetical protein S4CHLAM2_08020 [Chlamydiales bacterium]|nr:hypothetical protein [Chlamydiales bacterium]
MAMILIIAKDPQERQRALNGALKQEERAPLLFDAEHFNAFFQELETLPFLSGSKVVVMQLIDQLDKRQTEQLIAYLDKPNPWIVLYLTAVALPANSKLVKRADQVMRVKEEKVWEKEKRLASWAVEEAAASGVVMTLPCAQAFVKAVDAQFLQSELEKLICFVGNTRSITLEAIQVISSPIHHETLWQLGDAVFSTDAGASLQIGRILLEDGMALFPLLAHLRTQFHTTQKILSALQMGGKPAVTEAFPYLKGGLLDKKVALAQKYGISRLKQGLVFIYETELKAKNSAIDSELLLEMLLVKLTQSELRSERTPVRVGRL